MSDDPDKPVLDYLRVQLARMDQRFNAGVCMTGRPLNSRLMQEVATAPRDGTTIEVKHGIHQQIVRAVWNEQTQAFVREGDLYRLTLHRVTGWRPLE